MQKSRRFLPQALLLVMSLLISSLWADCSAGVFRFREIAAEFGYGAGIENTKLLRLDAQWSFQPRLWRSDKIEVVGVGQLAFGMWKGDREIANLSATPILRLQGTSRSKTIRPYLEIGVGLHYISDIQMRRRVLSTNFQFGDHAGIGFEIGRENFIDIAYMFQHHSNASIKRPNSGINFHIIRVGYSF